MRFSRLGTLALILLTVIIGANCSYYNRIIARKYLVDGAEAYKARKFDQAEKLFRDAVARDPEGKTLEGKTAQLFLARTLHSQFIGNRGVTSKAEEAIQEYKKVLAVDITDNSSFKAIANLLENLNRKDEAEKWIIERTNNNAVPPDQRAEALTSLASKQVTCANEISDVEPVKKTVEKDGIASYQFTKPTDEKVFETFKQCIDKGTELVDRAIQLEPDTIKNPGNIDVKSRSDKELVELTDLDKKFQSAWSYKANALIQKMRLAEMEGKTEEKESFKKEAEAARDKFTALNDLEKKIMAEQDARKQAAAEAANTK
jgi:tetratricopeptide (TPR) repeat protein